MTNLSQTGFPPHEPKQGQPDWFVSAIQSNGSVGECLQTVVKELDLKSKFVAGLQAAISEKSPQGLDSVTEIGQKIRVLENTLRFRLTILSPERKGAWFRSASATTGPFKENLLSEPVFSVFDESDHGRVRMALTACWNARTLIDFPMRATDGSLWKSLLTLNFQLEQIDYLGHLNLRLSELPTRLPPHLESRALRAFLANVRSEILSHRNRLMECYRSLLDASERYWRHNATVAAQKPHRVKSGEDHVSSMKDRSSTTGRGRFKSSSDIEALRFMGFSDYPTGDDLKQRYHALALTMHPDRPTGNEQRFKLLNKSYRHLSKL